LIIGILTAIPRKIDYLPISEMQQRTVPTNTTEFGADSARKEQPIDLEFQFAPISGLS
jgi:hypothetical protein